MASSKEMPCLAIFVRAFLGSHSNFIIITLYVWCDLVSMANGRNQLYQNWAMNQTQCQDKSGLRPFTDWLR